MLAPAHSEFGGGLNNPDAKLEPGGWNRVYKSAVCWASVGDGLRQIADRWIKAPAETYTGETRNEPSRLDLCHELLKFWMKFQRERRNLRLCKSMSSF